MNYSQRHPVLTIGHSRHSFETFVTLLKQHNVTAIADVRSAPYSRFHSQFNRETLERSLRANGISYVFLGRELGGRSQDPSCYEQGRVQYARLASTKLFRSGIERVLLGSWDHRVGLMCAEKEPLECHRTLLVTPALVESGVVVQHILADGGLEPHPATMRRLLRLLGLPERDMFRSSDELFAEALARQEQRVAYVDERLVADTEGESQ